MGTVLRCVDSWLGMAGVVVVAGGVVVFGGVGCACVAGSCVMGPGPDGAVVCAYTRPAPTTVSAATVVVRILEAVMMVVLWKNCTGQVEDNSRKKRLIPD